MPGIRVQCSALARTSPAFFPTLPALLIQPEPDGRLLVIQQILMNVLDVVQKPPSDCESFDNAAQGLGSLRAVDTCTEQARNQGPYRHLLNEASTISIEVIDGRGGMKREKIGAGMLVDDAGIDIESLAQPAACRCHPLPGQAADLHSEQVDCQLTVAQVIVPEVEEHRHCVGRSSRAQKLRVDELTRCGWDPMQK
jgi:hypothetical protein